jgi:hypothetical protein
MPLSDHEQKIIDCIDEHGWFCTSVFGDEPGDTFSYSVGFSKTLSAPECIIFGLPTKLMHSMLWTVFRQIRDGAVLSDGARWSGLIEGFDCISRPVYPSRITREHFNSALWYWGNPTDRGAELQAFQMFWPGAGDGLFPWETNSSKIVRDRQPALYLPRGDGLA